MREFWARTFLVELIGVFGVVFFSAGVVCVNQMTSQDRAAQEAEESRPSSRPVPPVTLHQPGLFGVALAQAISTRRLRSRSGRSAGPTRSEQELSWWRNWPAPRLRRRPCG